MINRILLLAALVATVGYSAPMTIVFSGNATGTVGATAFTNQPFTITFTSDTASVTHGTTCCAEDFTTPSGTSATFDLGSGGSGTLTDNQAVFVHQSEQGIGIWHYNSPDYLTIGHPTFSTYTLASSIGPISGTTNVFPGSQAMASSKGAIVLASVTGVTVTISVGAGTPQTPVISSIGTAYSSGMAQNTWVAIVGTNLVPSGTPATGVLWTGAASFATGQMPTSLNGVTVTVNGKPGYISFYCSGTTPGSICPNDQINVLTPLDGTVGPINVVVSNGSLSSSAIGVTLAPVSPAMLLFQSNYVTATHADYSLLGPTTLYAGLSTPASVGETVVLWTIGFGMPAGPLTQGSDIQLGALPAKPVCQINGADAPVSFAGVVSPGLYQLNVTIPNGATNGDNKVSCTYNGASTQDGLVITVAR